jgi:type IV secretory pathway component VirB8
MEVRNSVYVNIAITSFCKNRKVYNNVEFTEKLRDVAQLKSSEETDNYVSMKISG